MFVQHRIVLRRTQEDYDDKQWQPLTTTTMSFNDAAADVDVVVVVVMRKDTTLF